MTAAARPSLWQRLRALAGAQPAKTADVLPVRVGGTEYRRTTVHARARAGL
ncbi:cell division protein FtsW [Alicycliphilus sp. B1]|nr:cell division protein FtsW [Alicycliphilus sp. B1]